VGSHRRAKPASRARVTVLTATAAAAVAMSAQVANADPKPSVSDVKAQVDSLNSQAEQATQQYDGAQEQQSQLQQQVSDLQNKVAGEQANLNKMIDNLGSLAASQYRDGGIDPSLQLFLSSNPDDYLQKASTLEQLTGMQTAELQQIQQQERLLDQQRQEASAKLAQLDNIRQELAQKKQDVQSKLAQAQNLLNSLSAQQQAQVEGGGVSNPDLGNEQASSSQAAAALAAAETRIGLPYVWGATGPSSFDCSGLTSWAYAQAGISIPRTSQEQVDAGQQVPVSELRPGDLVIFFSDAHHVGLYAGNGMVLHAPHPGADVRFESISTIGPVLTGVRV
jgi:peptidoglycan DL-endopeptidase CwlO